MIIWESLFNVILVSVGDCMLIHLFIIPDIIQKFF